METLTQSDHRVTIKLIVISICNGIGIPLVALMMAANILKNNGITMEIHYTLTVEKDSAAKRLADQILEQHQYPGQVQHLDNLEQLPQWISDHMQPQEDPEHLLNKCTLLVLSGTPCKSISHGARLNLNRKSFGLHANPSNTWFLAHQSIAQLTTCFPQHRLLVFIENVVPSNQQDTQELDNTAGFRSEMHTTSTDGIKRRRYIWTSIKIPQQHPLEIKIEPIIHSETWTFQSNTPMPTLRAIFPTLFWKVAEEQPVPYQDIKTVSDCYMLRGKSEEPRLPDIPLWCDMMGMDNTTLQALSKSSPCQTPITLFPKDPNPCRQEQCGQHVYCYNCSEILSHLGEAWNLKSSIERLTRTLKAFADIHADQDQESVPKTFSQISFKYNTPVHICSNACPKARNKP